MNELGNKIAKKRRDLGLTQAEFAEEIFRLAGVSQRIQPCTTAEFPRPAPRPLNSRLEKRMLRLCGLPPMPDWHDSLAEFITNDLSR